VKERGVWREAAARGIRLFRFGFLCHRPDDGPRPEFASEAVDRNWQRRELPGLVLWTCPELPAQEFGSGGRQVLLAGSVQSCSARSVAEVAAALAVAEDADFLSGLDDLTGRFVLFRLRPEGGEIYNDPSGSRSIFYRPGLAAASHALLLARAYEMRRDSVMRRLVASPGFLRRGPRYLPGDRTMFDGVLALIPNHCLDLRTGGCRRYWPRSSRPRTTMDEFLAAGRDILPRVLRQIAGVGRPVLGVTAGVDSRTLIAAHKAAGLDFETMTWGTRSELRTAGEVIREIAALAGAPHRVHLSEASRGDPVTLVAGKNSGGFRGKSSVPKVMRDAYGDGEGLVFVRGWGAEVLKGYYQNGRNALLGLTTSDMVGAYLRKLRRLQTSREFMEEVETSFSGFIERGDYAAIAGLGYDPNDIFYLEHRVGMWCGSVMNEVDVAIRSFIGFNSRRLMLAAWGLPDEQRLTPELMRKLCAEFDPAIAKVGAPGEARPAAASRVRQWWGNLRS
jgi:hypothetical protein